LHFFLVNFRSWAIILWLREWRLFAPARGLFCHFGLHGTGYSAKVHLFYLFVDRRDVSSPTNTALRRYRVIAYRYWLVLCIAVYALGARRPRLYLHHLQRWVQLLVRVPLVLFRKANRCRWILMGRTRVVLTRVELTLRWENQLPMFFK